MIAARVKCKGDTLLELSADTYRALCERLMSGILACHASRPFAQEELEFELLDAEEADSERVSLLIECIENKCGKQKLTLKDEAAPKYLVPALALVFHTAHEGHAMRLTVDGESWESPVRKQ